MYGLSDYDLDSIINILKAHPQIDEAIIFGSRALNTYKKGSDIDIALKGQGLEKIASMVSGILNEESHLPYFCDVLDYSLIDNEDLKDHIDRVGKSIYKR